MGCIVPGASRVPTISSSMHADAITPTEPLGAVAILPNGDDLPLNSAGSASATSVFEACSAFTRISACMVARSPEVTVTQSTSPHLLPPAALWLLPAERPIDRVGFAPTGDRQLSRHTEFLAQPSTGTSVIASCQISCGKNGTIDDSLAGSHKLLYRWNSPGLMPAEIGQTGTCIYYSEAATSE